MGCCFSGPSDDSEVELSTVTNDAVTCKCGARGDGVQVTRELENNCWNVEGNGTVLGSCALEADTATWQVKLGKNPKGVKVGVKRYNKKGSYDLEKKLDDDADPNSPSWYLSDVAVKTGDIVEVYWDQTDRPMLSFSVNGEVISTADVSRIRPSNDIHPAISVAKDSSCQVFFDGQHFVNEPKSSKFKMIICSTSLI